MKVTILFFLLTFVTSGSIALGQDSAPPEPAPPPAKADENVQPLAQKNSKGVTYYLHSVEVKSKKGSVRTFYFFTKTIPARKGSPVAAVPKGYMISETKNGLPVLKKQPTGDGDK